MSTTQTIKVADNDKHAVAAKILQDRGVIEGTQQRPTDAFRAFEPYPNTKLI